MPHLLSARELQAVVPAEVATFPSPVPTQIVSNGEFNPLPQTRDQALVEFRIKALAEELAPHHGMDRRRFLASAAGMAAAFLAMNEVFGGLFDVTRAEAQQPGAADARAGARRPVHRGRADALRPRRLQARGPSRARAVREAALEPGPRR